MSDQLYESSGRFKALLLGIALIIIVALLVYTDKLVDDLRQETRGIIQTWAEIYANAASDATNEYAGFIFEYIIKPTNFPIVYADENYEPSFWKGIDLDENDRSPENKEKVKKVMTRMEKINEPISVDTYIDPDYGSLRSYIFYGDSSTITQLRWLPYIEIGLVSLFIFVGFIGFSTMKKSEQRFLWVGMSKETAHQLGTPISSLLGWIQLLRERSFNRPESIKVIDEMDQDVKRLGNVAERFSQIGSNTDIRDHNIHIILKDVIQYIQRRLPQMKKTVSIEDKFSEVPFVPVNADLIEWVFENIIKNAVDAIDHEIGLIQVVTGPSDRKGFTIFVDFIDNGRGILFKKKSDVFRPGFSTKKRGWGLGLNLAKRIVEEYHNGKLLVKDSRAGVGTTMRVYL